MINLIGTKLEIKTTTKFKKQFKNIIKQGKDINKFAYVLEKLANKERLGFKYRDHALFVAFAPYDNPRYGVAVLVEHGGGGSTVAAPIASKILQEALKLNILN